MLWTSIATGKMAYHHGVPGFTEVDPGTGAVVLVSAATRTRNVMAVYDRAVDEISQLFMPYHPPRLEGSPRPTSISLPGRGAVGFFDRVGAPPVGDVADDAGPSRRRVRTIEHGGGRRVIGSWPIAETKR